MDLNSLVNELMHSGNVDGKGVDMKNIVNGLGGLGGLGCGRNNGWIILLLLLCCCCGNNSNNSNNNCICTQCCCKPKVRKRKSCWYELEACGCCRNNGCNNSGNGCGSWIIWLIVLFFLFRGKGKCQPCCTGLRSKEEE